MRAFAAPAAVLTTSLVAPHAELAIGSQLNALTHCGLLLRESAVPHAEKHAAYLGIVAIAARYPVSVPDPAKKSPRELSRDRFYEDAYAEVARRLQQHMDRQLLGLFSPRQLLRQQAVKILKRARIGDLASAVDDGFISRGAMTAFTAAALIALRAELVDLEVARGAMWAAYADRRHRRGAVTYASLGAVVPTLFVAAHFAFGAMPTAELIMTMSIVGCFGGLEGFLFSVLKRINALAVFHQGDSVSRLQRKLEEREFWIRLLEPLQPVVLQNRSSR